MKLLIYMNKVLKTLKFNLYIFVKFRELRTSLADVNMSLYFCDQPVDLCTLAETCSW